MLTSDFDFNLPANLIAQEPFFPKEKTKMLVYKDGKILDSQVSRLVDFLQAGDLLVFNDAKVIKAKLSAKILRNSAYLDFNLDQENQGIWQALCKPAKKIKVGDILEIAADFSAEVIEKTDDGFIKIKFDSSGNELAQKLDKYGSIPLPPYIKRGQTPFADDLRNYQTIYAKNGTAVAAPTAGLHFNEKIFAALEAKKINKTFITLNVGAGTFLPVRTDNIKDHKMHYESFCISDEAAEIINKTKAAGRRIVAVGTTSLRALESVAQMHERPGGVSKPAQQCSENKATTSAPQHDENDVINSQYLIADVGRVLQPGLDVHAIKPGNYTTNIFIYPPYKFKVADILMTNFHLPKSTLFMLVSAFIGKEKALELYNHAINNNYRFYSYGDSSLLFKNFS